MSRLQTGIILCLLSLFCLNSTAFTQECIRGIVRLRDNRLILQVPTTATATNVYVTVACPPDGGHATPTTNAIRPLVTAYTGETLTIVDISICKYSNGDYFARRFVQGRMAQGMLGYTQLPNYHNLVQPADAEGIFDTLFLNTTLNTDSCGEDPECDVNYAIPFDEYIRRYPPSWYSALAANTAAIHYGLAAKFVRILATNPATKPDLFSRHVHYGRDALLAKANQYNALTGEMNKLADKYQPPRSASDRLRPSLVVLKRLVTVICIAIGVAVAFYALYYRFKVLPDKEMRQKLVNIDGAEPSWSCDEIQHEAEHRLKRVWEKIVRERYIQFFFAFAFLAFISLWLKLRITTEWHDGVLERDHLLLLDFNLYNNIQSRLLQFWIPELFIRLFGVSIINAYILQRFIFTVLTFNLFFIFLKKWFDSGISFACVAVFAMVSSLTIRDELQESSPLLGLTFLITLWAIRENKLLIYVYTLWFGAINNETMLFTPAVYFFVNAEKSFSHLIKLAFKTLLYTLPALITVGYIRYITWDKPIKGGAFWWHANMLNWYFIPLVFGIFWLYAFLRFAALPGFLQRSLLTIPLFILLHFISAAIDEMRLMLPLAFIVLPPAFFYLLESGEFGHPLKAGHYTFHKSSTP